MDGINGFNVRTIGVSRNQVHVAAEIVKGGVMLVMDDPELVTEAKAAGAVVIYRQSGDGSLPDIDIKDDERLKAWMFAFVNERAKKGADVIHFFNEISSSPLLHKLTKIGMDICVTNGWKCVIYNYGPNTPVAQFEDARSNIKFAIEHHFWIGVHVYLEEGVEHRAGAFEWLDMKHELGGRWAVTEFNFIRSIFDANKGPRNYLGTPGHPTWNGFADKETPLFNRENMPLCWFSFDPWPTDPKKVADGFGFWDNTDFISHLGVLNGFQKVKEIPVSDIPAPDKNGRGIRITSFPVGIVYRNIRIQPNQSSQDIGNLVIGNIVTAYLDNFQQTSSGKWVFIDRPLEAVRGWVMWDGIGFEPLSDQGGGGSVTLPPPADGSVTLSNAEYDSIVTSLESALALLKGAKPPVESGAGF